MLNPLEEHYGYLTDRVKLERYQSAIRAIVRPEHVVLDLGCGSGILGLLALQAGAGKVLFVDESSAIDIARHTVVGAGFADRAEFYQENSYRLDLPERADVVLCDHIGYFGFDYDILRLLADARERFLKPGGIVVPAQVDLMLAPVDSEKCRCLVQQWRDGSIPRCFEWVAKPAANTKHAVDLGTDDLIAESTKLATLDLNAEKADFFSWQAEFIATRNATLDGLAGWFDSVLYNDIRITNAPSATDKLDRPQAFLPILEPAGVSAGQRIGAAIMARPHDYLITWRLYLPDSGKRFEQSTFNSLFLDNALRRMLEGNPDK